MSRSSSVDRICVHHIDWSNDALTILFCHLKNNQTGEGKGMHSRHVFANPEMPSCCPILALGVYLLTTESAVQAFSFK